MAPSTLLFSGLPLDVREPDLAELLTAPPIKLPPSSVAVTALYNSAGAFLGTFFVEVGSDTDAERVRVQFSGQVIDGSHTLAVHHVLKAQTPHPSVAQSAPAAPRQNANQQQGQQQQPTQRGTGAGMRQAVKPPTQDTRAPGLKLLSRMKGAGGVKAVGGDKNKQKLLLEKQRAALKKGKSNPGDLLLSRLAKGGPAKKTSAAQKVAIATGKGKARTAAGGKKAGAAGGGGKVARAKGKTADRMDVDSAPKPQQPKKKEQPKREDKARPKTQAELDEEMRAYERARRFAA